MCYLSFVSVCFGCFCCFGLNVVLVCLIVFLVLSSHFDLFFFWLLVVVVVVVTCCPFVRCLCWKTSGLVSYLKVFHVVTRVVVCCWLCC